MADATWSFSTVDTIAPTIVARSPAPAQTRSAPRRDVSVTFSEGMNPATVNGSTFQLRDAANNLVAAIVSYDPATRIATLTPSAPLSGRELHRHGSATSMSTAFID